MMKQRKFMKCVSLLFATILLAGSISVLPAKAGSSTFVIDNKTFEKELDVGVWNNPDGDVAVKDNALVFPKESTDSTSLITKMNAKISDKHINVIDADVTMQFVQLPKGEKFDLAFGLGSVEALSGEPGNVEVEFENNGGLKVGAVAYDDDGEKQVLVKPVACGSMGSNINIQVAITTSGVLDVKVGGKQICKKEIPVSGEGRFGFLQTGKCAAKVTKLTVQSYAYDRPENPNVVEDFEDGFMDTNALTHSVYFGTACYNPSYCGVEEVDGNKVMRFRNAEMFYFGTMYEYSNFELTFDIIGMQREDVVDEDGNIVSPKNMHFCVAFGGDSTDFTDYGFVHSPDMLIFDDASRVVGWHTGVVQDLVSKGYDYANPECDKDFSVQIKMVDSWVTVGMKWLDEEKFTEVFRYQPTTETPTGTVQIWTTATSNFSLDNFMIKNLDEDPNIIEVEPGIYEIEKPEDFDYKPLEYVYRPVEKEEGFNLYYVIAIVAGVCVLALILTVVIKKVCANKKAKKEAKIPQERVEIEEETGEESEADEKE